jgi:hypothetical protein
VNFVPDYKLLHDAGYTFSPTTYATSATAGPANGGIASSGIFEARDVLGSLKYVRSRCARSLRTVFVLREVEGLSIEQTAQVPNLSQAAGRRGCGECGYTLANSDQQGDEEDYRSICRVPS